MKRGLAAGVILAWLVAASGCASSGAEVSEQQGREASEANTKIAVQLLGRGEPQRALKKVNKAIQQDPENSNARMVRALTFQRLDRNVQAEDAYEEALSIDGSNPMVLNNYGKFLCSRGDTAEAQKYFDRAADIPTYESPEVPLTNAGICIFRKGNRDKAADYLQKALKRNDKQPGALLHMADIRLDSEQYRSAQGYYQRYLDVASQSPRSAWLGVRIENELGNKDALASYKQLLRNKFPDSEQTEKLLEWESDGRL